MNTIIFYRIVLILSIGLVTASVSRAQRVSITPKVSAALNSVDINSEFEYGETRPILRPSGGVDAEFNFTEKWSFKAGIFAARRGTNIDNLDQGMMLFLAETFYEPQDEGEFGGFDLSDIPAEALELDGRLRMTYIQIPLNLAYRFETGEDLRWQINGGGYFDYALSGYYEVDASIDMFIFSFSETFREELDFDSDLERFYYGVNLGTSLEYHRFVFFADYSLGLADISKSESSFIPEDFTVRNRFLNVGAGYRFDL